LKRVAITGMGCVTPLGTGVEDFEQNLFAGRDGFHPIPDVPAGELRFSLTAQVLHFDSSASLTAEQAQLSERPSQRRVRRFNNRVFWLRSTEAELPPFSDALPVADRQKNRRRQNFICRSRESIP
jgi:3-oxoacyl-(acyl-carrier-protein) synthase